MNKTASLLFDRRIMNGLSCAALQHKIAGRNAEAQPYVELMREIRELRDEYEKEKWKGARQW